MSVRSLLVGLALCLVSMPVSAAVTAPQRDMFATAVVQQIVSEEDDTFEGITRTVQHLVLRMESGPYAGQTFAVENGVLEGRSDMAAQRGSRVVVEIVERSDGTLEAQMREPYRIPGLLWLTGGFVLLAVVLGGWTGILSIAGLAVSVGVLVLFVIPRIVAGSDPLVTSMIGCILIAVCSLYIAHGIKRRTSVALLATIVTLILALFLAFLFVHVASLFGMGSEESLYLQMGQLQSVNLRGLLLGGMLLGALGVLDDITTAQCAVVDEVSKANPLLTSAQLREAGASVGREHIASLINTLALAYAGASLPLLLLLDVNSDFPLWVTLNGEFLVEEIVRTLVGSMALLLAVPISTWLASLLLRAAPGSHPVPLSGHMHGHHH